MDIKEKLIECLESIGVFVENTNEDVCINDYNVDSLMMISLILKIEETFSVDIPDECLTFETLSSLNGLTILIESLVEEKERFYCH